MGLTGILAKNRRLTADNAELRRVNGSCDLTSAGTCQADLRVLSEYGLPDRPPTYYEPHQR